jgi:hypothetical protein
MSSQSNHFAASAVWWIEKGVVHLIFIDSIPNNPNYPDEVQKKCPGGRSEGDETSEQVAVRELWQETGLKLKKRIKPISVYHPRADKHGHRKQGFIIPRSGCRGYLHSSGHQDDNSSLSRPYPITLDKALKVVFHNDRNKFHLNFLLAVRDYFAKKFGEEVVGPAKTSV